jgi:hypothetical protein
VRTEPAKLFETLPAKEDVFGEDFSFEAMVKLLNIIAIPL